MQTSSLFENKKIKTQSENRITKNRGERLNEQKKSEETRMAIKAKIITTTVI